VRPIREAPDWLVEAAIGNRKELTDNRNNNVGVSPLGGGKETPTFDFKEPTIRERRYALTALKNAQLELEACPEGERNHKLNVMAFKMGRLVARGWLNGDIVVQLLSSSAWLSGLRGGEIGRTIRSGLLAGVQFPYPDLKKI
jgi:hypothetical protein